MKILFFSRRFYPLIGGVEKHVLEISKRFIEKGYKVTVVTENEEGVRDRVRVDEDAEKVNGIKVYRIPVTTSEKLKKFQIWKWLWDKRRIIHESDIVHCHDVFYWYLPFRFLYPKKKVFTTFHGYEGSEPPKWNQILSHKMAGCLSFGSMAIGVSHEKWYRVESDEISYGAAENASLEQGGEPIPPARWKYDFCFAGRLAKDTGIMIYLEALKILKEKNKNFSLVVCGDGPQMNDAVDFVKKFGLNVEFKGFVKSVEKYLKMARFVFVSRYLGILESLLAKKLIFAVFDNEIKKDYLETAPFAKYILIEKDPVALSDKISYFASRPGKSKEKIKKGFAWAKQQTWEKLVNQYLSLWLKTKFRLLRRYLMKNLQSSTSYPQSQFRSKNLTK